MEINQDMLLQYGLMQKLSTGHSLLDALLVMLVPLLINHLLPHIRSGAEKLQKWWKTKSSARCQRAIIHKQNAGERFYCYNPDGDDLPNHKLQQAILVYLNTLPHLFNQMESAHVQLCKCKQSKQKAFVFFDDDDDDGNAGDHDGSNSNSDGSDDWYPGEQVSSSCKTDNS